MSDLVERVAPVHDLHSALDGFGARSIAAAIRALIPKEGEG